MSDLNELGKFAKKTFRDGYLQTATRGGIAYQIQALREKFKLTQTQFAEKLGKKQSSVSRLENSEYGKVSVQTLLDIACSLDVALVVRFVSYPEFLFQTKNFSITALQPQTIYESIEAAKQVEYTSPGSALFQATHTSPQESRPMAINAARSSNDNYPHADMAAALASNGQFRQGALL